MAAQRQPAGGSLHTVAMAATRAPQPEPVNLTAETEAREDTTMGNDLIVEIPWIVFGLSLAAVCYRLCRFRRFSGRGRDREPQQPSDDGDGSSANRDKSAGNDHNDSAVSSSAQPSSTQS